jgi:hypothetical protein
MANKATDYKRKFNAEKYDRLEITVAKGKKAEIKVFAESKGKTLNGFVNEAIDEKIEREKE